MTVATWVTMIGILLFVWGGFALALTVAIRKEAGKSTNPPSDDLSRGSG